MVLYRHLNIFNREAIDGFCPVRPARHRPPEADSGEAGGVGLTKKSEVRDRLC